SSRAESLGGSSFRFCGLFFPILGRCIRIERTEKSRRNAGYFINCFEEGLFICLRRLIETTDFSYKLERSRANLFVGDWRIEVEEGFKYSCTCSQYDV